MNPYKWALIVFIVFAIALCAFRAVNKDTRGAFTIGAGVVLLGMLFIVAGCSVSPERRPWMEVGMGYEFAGTVGEMPQCIVRIRQPVHFGPIPEGGLILGYEHLSSCPSQKDLATIDAIELIAVIPLGRRK
jgi:hypothetical protein